jgi:hypothetical protein
MIRYGDRGLVERTVGGRSKCENVT